MKLVSRWPVSNMPAETGSCRLWAHGFIHPTCTLFTERPRPGTGVTAVNMADKVSVSWKLHSHGGAATGEYAKGIFTIMLVIGQR